MKALASALLLPAFLACQPIKGSDPLDSVGSNSPLILATPEEKTESGFRGELGVESSADF